MKSALPVLLHGLTAALLCGLLAAPATAGTLELRQAGEVGAGTGFRRHDACLVLTAAHVVKEDGVDVTVLDGNGARATGQVVYSNPLDDVALVALPPGSAVVCGERWPDSDWMAAARWTPRSELEVLRRYPNGREAVIRLRWAGGSKDTLSLASLDRSTIQASDSGSLVQDGERMAGIVKLVDTALDRVEVVRFDLIDRLVGDRFRASARALMFDGVFQGARPHAAWTTYARAWLTDAAGRSLAPAGDASAACRLRVEVVNWAQRNAANPQHAQLTQKLAQCRNNILFQRAGKFGAEMQRACEAQTREALKTTPRTQRVHTLQVKADATPRVGPAVSRLGTHEAPEPAAGSRAEVERQVLQAALADVGGALLGAGACD
jgi:hypothetical protein